MNLGSKGYMWTSIVVSSFYLLGLYLGGTAQTVTSISFVILFLTQAKEVIDTTVKQWKDELSAPPKIELWKKWRLAAGIRVKSYYPIGGISTPIKMNLRDVLENMYGSLQN